MKNLVITCALFFLTLLNAYSQNQPKAVFTIKGEVADSVSNESVPFATISASKKQSPALPIKRVAADANGKFEMSIESGDTLLVKFDAVGMISTTIPVTSTTEKVINLGKVLIAPNERLLSEVTVTAAKPLVKVELDKIIYDMKSDPESQTSNTLDMLRKVPMITIDGEENIQVKGQSNFKIFMNGKATNIISNNPSQVLKSIPANTIKSIEVITEPGAKYEAEGLAGIINIITESAMKGYTGTVRAGVDNYGALNGGIYFSTKIGKWGITTNLNQGMFRNPGTTSLMTRESTEASDYKHLEQVSDGSSKGNYRYGSLSVSYELDSLNLFTLSGNTWGNNYSSDMKGNTWISPNLKDTTQAYSNNSESNGLWAEYSGSLDYQRSFKKPDKLLTTSYKIGFTPNNSDYESDIISIKNYFDRKQQIQSTASSTEHTFQLDYTEPFNKKHVMEVGAKYIYRINLSDNDYKLYNKQEDIWEPMPGMSDSGIFHTYGILGAYGSYTFKLDKFSVRAGGRLEHTNASIEYNPDSAFRPKPFLNLIPSITLSYKTTPASSIQLSYTQRVSRPSIYYLNPFKDISDPKNVSQGNPDLVPEISNSFNLNYNLFTPKFNFNSSIYTAFANNSIERVSSLQDTVVYSTYENIGRSRSTGLSTYFRWQLHKNINIYFNGSGRYSYYSYELDNKKVENDGFRFSGYMGGSYTLPKDFRINANGGLSSPSVTLQGKSNGYYYYSLSLNKSLLKKKLNMSVYANGFLEKYIEFKSSTNTDTYRSENTFTRQSPRFGFNVSYTFGQMKEQIKKVERGIDNSDVKSGGGSGAQGGGTGGGGS